MDMTIYTNYLVVTYHVKVNGMSKEDIAKALDEGPILLDTEEGGTIFVNPINAVLIELKDTPHN